MDIFGRVNTAANIYWESAIAAWHVYWQIQNQVEMHNPEPTMSPDDIFPKLSEFSIIRPFIFQKGIGPYP